MEQTRTFADLSYGDLQVCPAWRSTGTCDERGNQVLKPVRLGADGSIPASVEEVWCLCKCRFADATEHGACSSCDGDTSEGPLAWSVWNGDEFIPIIVPPAPDFVLEKEGPIAFCRAFNLESQAVFPLEIEVVPAFEIAPHRRSVLIDSSGRLTFGK